MENNTRIENWAMIIEGDQYTPPELWKQRITGKVYNHPKFEDGSAITSSSIKEFNLSKRLAITRNTEYTLGVPSEEYLELYPEAK